MGFEWVDFRVEMGFELVFLGLAGSVFWMWEMERGSGRWDGPLCPAIFAFFI